ncbi:hypothetical protein RUND412_007625 [Rhizina undulata]
MNIIALDHLVLTVRSIPATKDFYSRVLGLSLTSFTPPSSPKTTRYALSFGAQKFNLHEYGHEFEPKANMPTPGSLDFCLITGTGLEEAMEHVRREGVEIVEGPVERTGSRGRIRSFYVRDPDKNLVEIANYV